ncbi:hypothetical protein EV06_0871 [Prochlorococcus sp. MIT 0602]|nr:hypothetical protein EV06_0871 [Prochlorococcus sp. MIT 0602]KGG17281.1 hypothetical protein EV07_0719 [Prochlorococcus sp. MIT 0603]
MIDISGNPNLKKIFISYKINVTSHLPAKSISILGLSF